MGDELTFFFPDGEWNSFEEIFKSKERCRISLFTMTFLPFFTRLHKFRRFYDLGIAVRPARAGGSLIQVMNGPKKWPIRITWIPLVALCHGIFSTKFTRQDYERAEKSLFEFMDHQGYARARKTIRSRAKGVVSKFLYFLIKQSNGT